jgi:hypothetical protein
MLKLRAEPPFQPLTLRVSICVFTLFSAFQTLGCPTFRMNMAKGTLGD